MPVVLQVIISRLSWLMISVTVSPVHSTVRRLLWRKSNSDHFSTWVADFWLRLLTWVATCNLTVCGRLGCIDAGSVIILHCVTFLRCSWHFWSKIFAHLSTRAFLKLFSWTKIVVLWKHTLFQLTVCYKATSVSTSIAVHIQNKISSRSPSR